LRLIVSVFILVFTNFLWAKGVKAGTIISNQATLNFSVGDSASYSITSNEVQNSVSQVLSMLLKWQDTKPVKLYDGAGEKVLNLSVLNNGNGKDKISISYTEDSSLSSIVKSMDIFIDSNKNGVFDKYDKKLQTLSLDADEEQKIFLVSSLKQGYFYKE
jgi:hypothetical protein